MCNQLFRFAQIDVVAKSTVTPGISKQRKRVVVEILFGVNNFEARIHKMHIPAARTWMGSTLTNKTQQALRHVFALWAPAAIIGLGKKECLPSLHPHARINFGI